MESHAVSQNQTAAQLQPSWTTELHLKIYKFILLFDFHCSHKTRKPEPASPITLHSTFTVPQACDTK